MEQRDGSERLEKMGCGVGRPFLFMSREKKIKNKGHPPLLVRRRQTLGGSVCPKMGTQMLLAFGFKGDV